MQITKNDTKNVLFRFNLTGISYLKNIQALIAACLSEIFTLNSNKQLLLSFYFC